MKKHFKKVITIAVYQKRPVYLYLGTDSSQQIKDFPSCKSDKDGLELGLGLAGANLLKDGNFAYYIIINSKYKNPLDVISTAYHESLHVTLFLLTDIGVHLDPINSEPITYLQGYIASELIQFLIDVKFLKIKQKK